MAAPSGGDVGIVKGGNKMTIFLDLCIIPSSSRPVFIGTFQRMATKKNNL
jgi:hypothetical protein